MEPCGAKYQRNRGKSRECAVSCRNFRGKQQKCVRFAESHVETARRPAGFLGNFLKYAGVLLRKRAETREIREKLAPCEVFFVFLCRIFAVYSADAQISELFAKNSQIFEEWLGDLCAEKALFFEKLLGKAISEARDSKKCKELLRLKQKLAEKTGGYSKLCSELKDLLRFDRKREGFTQKVLNEVFALWKKHALLSNSRINLNKYSIQCCF